MRISSIWLSHIFVSMLTLGTTKVADGLKSMLSRNAIRLHRKNYFSLADSHLSSDIVDALMQRVHENNDMSRIHSFEKTFIPFIFESTTYGYVSDSFAELLKKFPETFELTAEENISGCLRLAADVAKMNLIDRSAAVGKVTEELKRQKIITGWRDELLPVVASFSGQPALLMERAAVPWFGVKAYGVHINGYVKDPMTGEISLWVAKRSKTKSTFPGMYDHIVAGGQPHGITLMNNVIKECEEEASIPIELARLAKSTGAVSYTSVDKNYKLKRDALFCYDIELPASFIPLPLDGEVESFELQTLDWVLDKIVEGGPNGYKPNCNVVIIDFLIRHGAISAESPKYLDLVYSMRNSECC